MDIFSKHKIYPIFYNFKWSTTYEILNHCVVHLKLIYYCKSSMLQLKKKKQLGLHTPWPKQNYKWVSSFLGVFVSCLIHRIGAGAQLSIPPWCLSFSPCFSPPWLEVKGPTWVPLSFLCCFQGHTDGKNDDKGWITSAKLPRSVFPPSALNCYSQAMRVLGKN